MELDPHTNSAGVGLYVHIPFCASKCPYCDFVSGSVSGKVRQRHLEALRHEILQSPFSGDEAITLYLGGGTPSELTMVELEHLLDALSKVFLFSADAEWTIECNPNSATGSFLAGARRKGFNRLSLGAQSFHPRHLECLGRAHGVADIFEAFHSARKAGFIQINLDLIFAIPGQTLQEWKEDLETAIGLAPEHLSLYGLTIEPGTEFGRSFQSGRLQTVDSDLSADMFELAMDLVSEAGYFQYEISNYALEGFECRHNIRYWQNEPYLGFGLGATSLREGCRWTNTSDWDLYERTARNGHVARSVEEKLESFDAFSEEIMLRLRTRWGFSPKSLSQKYKCDFWQLLGEPAELFRKEGLLELRGDNLRLTRKGILLADEVCATFLSFRHTGTRPDK